MKRIVIPHLKPILNVSKLKIEMEIEMKWYIFLSVQWGTLSAMILVALVPDLSIRKVVYRVGLVVWQWVGLT